MNAVAEFLQHCARINAKWRLIDRSIPVNRVTLVRIGPSNDSVVRGYTMSQGYCETEFATYGKTGF